MAVKRKPLTRLQRTIVFDDAQGACCICHIKIDHLKEKWIVEHLKPLWLGGEDNARNMGPAHYRCAIEKTTKEAPVKAKSDRVRANFLGIKKTTNPIPGSRNTKFKKRMDGTVVLR